MAEEQVILVDEHDKPIGTMGKLEAHQKGQLHRAFSVFIFNDKGELLLQKRALSKYHSAGLWTNTCCSHPKPNEETLAAANRRLREEMGLDSLLIHKTSFIYKTPFDNGLTEHEFDHVFIGQSNEDPIINLEEVDSFKWLSLENVKEKIKRTPESFTSWFKIALGMVF
ncbi:MAG: isopentenyl-diphosphate Delta-isomerase [Bacteroidota bacterium]|nr:isopentenyl-diphosphate Delta-isomerase [Bacteroidota bacterium]